jgi:gamma-glutamyl phosphate reductase
LRVRLVDSLNQALALIQVCGQGNMAALLTDSCETARRFGVAAEAAVVAVNGTAPLIATRLCDGFCLGMAFGADNGPLGIAAFTVNKQTVSD